MSKRHYAILFLLFAACLVGIILLFSVKDPSLPPSNEPATKYRVEIILKARSNPPDFWRIVEQGVTVAAEEYGVDCRVAGAATEDDVDGQIALVEEAVARRPQAILLAASDRQRLVPVCRKIVQQGIRLILIDSDVDYDGKSCFVGTDNVALGKKLAQELEAASGGTGRFGVIGHVEASATAEERRVGLLENVKNADARLAAIAYCDSDVARSRELTAQMLRDHPDIRCMVGLNESSALGISQALEELRLGGKVKLIACDSSSAQIQSMERGTIQAFVIQNPFNMGYVGVQYAAQLLQGRQVPAVYDTGSVVIKREDMYSTENQKRLFPFIDN